MIPVLARAKRRISYMRATMITYFADCGDELNKSNWRTLRYMAWDYIGFLLIYRFAVCSYIDIPVQTAALRVSIFAHIAFGVWVYHYGRKTPSITITNITITAFAFEILALSGFIGVAVFPEDAAFLFPVVLILITQIYTRPIQYSICETLSSLVVFLVCSCRVKTLDVFVLDLIGVFIALGVAGVSYFSLMAFRLHTYQSRCALQKMCETDAMTGVNNKTTFQYRVESYLLAVYRSAVVALAVCDLDDFKGVNDKHGHRIGDQVLKAFAARMHKIADDDPNAIIGRFGGDEFVIFFKNARNEKRILKALRALCEIDGFDFPVTCSIGVAFSGSDIVLFDKLFDRADQNAYHAKENASERIFASKTDDP